MTLEISLINDSVFMFGVCLKVYGIASAIACILRSKPFHVMAILRRKRERSKIEPVENLTPDVHTYADNKFQR